jgi:carotenoid cleavage dioxygenase-like enzyme
MTQPKDRKLLTTSRRELDVELNILEGQIPDDIHGHFFVVYPVGNVNSALPISETMPDGSTNPDYGSPLMNGDGMVMRIDFDQKGKVGVKSRLMKTADYYADEGSKFGTEFYKSLGFVNHGIVRMSRILGARNEANTAVVPVQFKNQEHPSLLITYDCGRPCFLDPVSLEVKSPIGYVSEWSAGMPDAFREVFPMIETTAHPAFDPYTKELFTVNFTKSNETTFSSGILQRVMHKDEDLLKKELGHLKEKMDVATSHSVAIGHIDDFFKRLENHLKPKGVFAWLENLLKKLLEDLKGLFQSGIKKVEGEFENPDRFFLIRFDGENPMKKWEVVLENGDPIVIHQCMHQIALNKDYILLVDTSFKFSLDLLLKSPAADKPWLEKLIREALAVPMLPYCDSYIVKRSDLKEGVNKITAKKLKSPLPLETVHFNSTYNSDGGKMDIFCIHNSAVCMAEWIRPYDINKLNHQPVDKDYIGLFSIGDMDISRLGQYTLDCEKADIEDEFVFHLKGKAASKDCGPSTWGIGLISYPDIVSPTAIPNDFKYVWYMSNGPDPNMLTEFIYRMYDKYPNRLIPVKEVLEFNKAGMPFVLNRYNCKEKKVDDYYELGPFTYLRAHYYIPSNDSSKGEYDGYLCTTLQIGVEEEGNLAFHNEVWIFDCRNIGQGPICRLNHPELEFCFQLHSAWLPEIHPHQSDYAIDEEQDIKDCIDRLWLEEDRELATKLMEEAVYPNLN